MTDPKFHLCEPAKGKTAVRAAFRASMEHCAGVFLCGDADGHHIRKAARQLEHLDIAGGLVLVGDVIQVSPRQALDKTCGQITEPAGPGDIYPCYMAAADLAFAYRSLVYLPVPCELWAGAEQDAGAGHIRREEVRHAGVLRAKICPECRYLSDVTAVREILVAKDIPVTAIACQGPGFHESCVIGSPPPCLADCGAVGIWIETPGNLLLVYVGDGPQGLVGLDAQARDLGSERIFYCDPSCDGNLASAIHGAVAWPGKAAVLALKLEG